nr:hypothetical protein [Polyangiaceae bacterium]
AMSQLRLPVVSLVLLLVALLACGDLSMEEAGYRNNLKDYDALVEKAHPPMKATVEAKRQAYKEAHDKLPAAEAERVKALTALNKAADKEIEDLEGKVEAANKVHAAANASAMKAYQAKFVGTWEGDGMHLRIDEKGGVDYTRKSGAVNKSLTGASVKEFRREAFDVSLLGVKTTFKIDAEPKEVGGVWSMTVDGAKLTKVAGPSGELPLGTFTCRVLVNELCVDRTDRFPDDEPEIRMSYRSDDVPKADSKYKVQWIAENVGPTKADKIIATANTELTLDSAEPIEHVNLWSNIKKPKDGWPSGKYRVEVSREGKNLATARFSVGPPEKP